MFHKDTFRLIWKTRKRFVAVMLIVLIGVGFMVGLMACAPTMRKSVDKYFDDYNFMDVQLYSSYGFDYRDIKALRKSEVVDDIYATRFVDTFVKHEDATIVTRVQELKSNVNRYHLLEGRMPENKNEAVALGASDASFGAVFKVGDKVKVYLEDEDLSETLSVCEYEIVGLVHTPQYLASSRETSTLDNLNLTTAIYVDNRVFLKDYYTSVYLTIKGAKEYNCFSDEYSDYISDKLDELDGVISRQQVVRRDEIINEITQEISDGEKELNKEIAAAQSEIDDGRKKLEEAYIQLLVGEAQVESSKKQVETGEWEISKNEALVADGEKQIADAKKRIAAESGMSFEEAAASIKSAYTVYNIVGKVLENSDFPPETTIMQQIDKKTEELNTLRDENTALHIENIELEAENSTIRAANTFLENQNTSLEEENSHLESDAEANAEQIERNKTQISENNQTIEANKKAIASNEAKIAQNNETVSENTSRIAELSGEISELESLRLVVGDDALGQIPAEIDKMFNGSVTDAYNGILQLEDAESELEYGRRQLTAARTELETGKKQLADAEKQIKSGHREYEKGLAELEDAQKKLDEEYEKAKIELDKAKQQLSELPDAEWTVLDRDSHYSTIMFKNNADQMKRIGDVFPLLFCLVAALVCMTTMKRLVDEERSQIGVFSAIGFSKGKIISKYAIYAFSASIIGSGIGVPLGVLSLPWVVYYCWRMMYDLPDMILWVPAYITVLGVMLFTVLMLWVTVTVVRGVLKESPSQLMRPKAPRNAKKVFLEKIPFIWQRLSFTSKVTARNIIRYKSRFFMTVVGVAGCTSLLVLGFAIKGSISQVITRQYQDIIAHNITITMEDSEFTDAVVDKLHDDPNVRVAVSYMTYSTMAYTGKEDKAIQVYITEEDDISDIFNLRERRSRNPLSLEKGVIISEKFSNLCEIGVGDEILIESCSGIKQAVRVTAICEMYTQHFMFMSDEYYYDIFGETVRNKNIAVSAADTISVKNKYEDREGVKTIADFSETIATFSSMLDTLDIIVVVIIIAAGALALVVIMNLTEVNISERIREIATLKVLGFNNQEVYSYIFKEVFLLSLIGIVVGLPLAKLELVFVMRIIEMEMVMFSTVIQPLSYIYGVIIILIFTVSVIMLMRKTLRNVQMVESLKSVE